MKYEIKIFIGADNKTHKINEFYKSKVTDILNFYFDGYNMVKSEGYYKSNSEECFLITIYQNSKTLKKLKAFLIPIVEQLKNELIQEAIILNISKPYYNNI
jgi:hypothetical protein